MPEDSKRFAERVRDAVHQYGPTAVAFVRLVVDVWFLGVHGPGR